MYSSPLRNPGFRWFFGGQLVSLLGSSMAPVALAFAVLDASGRSGDLGLVLAARMVPMLAFLLVGGATADRLPRRTVLLAANLGSALTQGAVAVLLLTGHYALLAVAGLELLNGVLAAFTTPALRGVVPQLVAKDQLQRANALLGSTRNATKILGPSVSGVLVVAVGSGPAIACDALSYLLAAGCLARLALADGGPLSGTAAFRPGTVRTAVLYRDIREGWTEFRRIRWAWLGSWAFFVINLVQTGTWQILGPLLTQQRGSAAIWGLVLSARGLGLLVTSVLMYRVTVRYLLRLSQLACALGALPLLALGSGIAAPWLVAAAFVGGLGSSVTVIGWDTSLQEHVPAAVLSRVSSYSDLLSYLAIPIGQLSVGPLTHAFGGARVTAVAGLVDALAALAPLAARSVRRLPRAPV
ncbi:MFS transporter [Kitasatospora sp. NBC_01266]|uniref:MFS transporter n=1 Tax=Kitasatospora sp. NBC_01266 TaxID=2903572 RepID=UPI002E380376|nr:MFS transporter [Kitasatospora sp. NBC_01266]